MLAATRWVVMGDVLNAAKPASRIVRRLLDNNKTVHLVNPRAPSAAGASPVVHSSLSAVLKDNPVDVVDVVINPAESVTHTHPRLTGSWQRQSGGAGSSRPLSAVW